MFSTSKSLPQRSSLQGRFTSSGIVGAQGDSGGAAGQIASFCSRSPAMTPIPSARKSFSGMNASHMDKNSREFGKPVDTSCMGGIGCNPSASGCGSAGGVQSLLASLLGNLGEGRLDNLLKSIGEPVRACDGLAFSNEDKEILKEVAHFIDMFPEEFGEPSGKFKPRVGDLSEGDQFMSGQEIEQFQKAIDLIKGEIQGISLVGLSPNPEQNFINGGAGNTLEIAACIAAGNVLSVLTQQLLASYRG